MFTLIVDEKGEVVWEVQKLPTPDSIESHDSEPSPFHTLNKLKPGQRVAAILLVHIDDILI